MNHQALKKIDQYIAAWGILVTIAALALKGTATGVGVFVGGAIALLNWMAFRYLGLRMMNPDQRMRFGLVLGVKSILLLGVIAVICLKFPINPVPLAIGFSSLILGIVTYSFGKSSETKDAAMNKEA